VSDAAAPHEVLGDGAASPESAIRAPRSSTSRSTAYGGVAALPPPAAVVVDDAELARQPLGQVSGRLPIAGGASPESFRDATARIAEVLPDATLTVLERQGHGAPADVVPPVVAAFLDEAVDDGAG
jgi:hypothetical protein